MTECGKCDPVIKKQKQKGKSLQFTVHSYLEDYMPKY